MDSVESQSYLKSSSESNVEEESVVSRRLKKEVGQWAKRSRLTVKVVKWKNVPMSLEIHFIVPLGNRRIIIILLAPDSIDFSMFLPLFSAYSTYISW